MLRQRNRPATTIQAHQDNLKFSKGKGHPAKAKPSLESDPSTEAEEHNENCAGKDTLWMCPNRVQDPDEYSDSEPDDDGPSLERVDAAVDDAACPIEELWISLANSATRSKLALVQQRMPQRMARMNVGHAL